MAIKNRQGKAQDFVPTKLLGGEFAVVQEGDESTADGSALYLATKAGSVKRIPFAGEVDDLKTQVDDVVEDAKEAIESAIDPTLAQSGKAADAKATGDKISGLKSGLSDLGAIVDDIEPGLSEESKAALLACFRGVAWVSQDSQTLYNNLENALNASTKVVSISAIFNQGSAVIYPEDTLDSLRSFLTVTATYDNGKTLPALNYDLSGQLTVGTSVITVTYKSKTTTFNVVVGEPEWGTDYTWLYRPSEDGLLSSNINVSAVVAVGGATLATETLNGDTLNLSAEYDGVNHGSIFKLIPLTTTSAVLKAKIRFNALPIASPGGGLRLQVSNGTNGAQLFVYRDAENPNQPRISTFSPTLMRLADITLNKWYVLTCELSGDTQVIKVDDTTYRQSALSNYANTETRFIVLEPDSAVTAEPGNTNIDVAWIAFKNNA